MRVLARRAITYLVTAAKMEVRQARVSELERGVHSPTVTTLTAWLMALDLVYVILPKESYDPK